MPATIAECDELIDKLREEYIAGIGVRSQVELDTILDLIADAKVLRLNLKIAVECAEVV
jgi:hypothetical protein